jgi:DNA-binding NarL/FixJ family response regulator
VTASEHAPTRRPSARTWAEAPAGRSTAGGSTEGTSQPRLSRREKRILSLMAQGLTDREIATTLRISEDTVGRYVGAIRRKLSVRSRTEAAVVAIRQHLVQTAHPRRTGPSALGGTHGNVPPRA